MFKLGEDVRGAHRLGIQRYLDLPINFYVRKICWKLYVYRRPSARRGKGVRLSRVVSRVLTRVIDSTVLSRLMRYPLLVFALEHLAKSHLDGAKGACSADRESIAENLCVDSAKSADNLFIPVDTPSRVSHVFHKRIEDSRCESSLGNSFLATTRYQKRDAHV